MVMPVLCTSTPAHSLLGCDLRNVENGIRVPIHGILYNGTAFEFFQFNGRTWPYTFLRGCFPGDPMHLQRGLPLADASLLGSRAFSISLRPICDTILDTLLVAYSIGLAALRSKARKLSKDSTEYDMAVI